MGCFVSSVELPQNRAPLFSDGLRRNPFLKVVTKPSVVQAFNMDDQTRQVLYSIIQRDNVAELGLGLDEWGKMKAK